MTAAVSSPEGERRTSSSPFSSGPPTNAANEREGWRGRRKEVEGRGDLFLLFLDAVEEGSVFFLQSSLLEDR